MVDNTTVKKLNLTDYEQGATLGTGSFGRVKIAKHKKTGYYVALKCMKKMEIIKSKQTDHIMNEIKILSKNRCTPMTARQSVFSRLRKSRN